jgi:hypothetical protein
VAKKEHLKPIELELKRMEDVVASIHNNVLRMQEVDVKMRESNVATSSRVLWWSVFSSVSLIGLSIAQVVLLRSYFKSKNLIE